MKLNFLETHDRLLHFKKDQALNLSQGAEDCLKKNELSKRLQQYSPYIYLFAHPRTADDGVNKRMIWQPRLSRPKSQTNSYLFRAKSNTDLLEICWLLPPREMWPQYQKGKIAESEYIIWSINHFLYNREKLDTPFQDDLPDEKCKDIYIKVASEIDQEVMIEKLYNIKQETEEAS